MNAILYIIELFGGKVDIYKLYITLYVADREHLSKYGRLITNDDYIASEYGPIPSRINDILKAVRDESYCSNIGEQDFGKYLRFF